MHWSSLILRQIALAHTILPAMIWVNYDLLFDEHKTGVPSISPNKIFRQIKNLKDVGSQTNNLFNVQNQACSLLNRVIRINKPHKLKQLMTFARSGCRKEK